MRYYSTSHRSPEVSLAQAVIHCVAPDGGVYMPAKVPHIPAAFFNNIDQLSLQDIAYVVANSLFGGDVDAAVLKRITAESFDFQIPLVGLGGGMNVLELFHGPSLSFKDMGTRFLARLYRHLSRQSGTARINVLVATTGNSGSAVANAFRGRAGVDGFIGLP
ncbi:MAG: threonine synthase, partial [Muribaculaceae bacterium]|nr:threonine synthase [Muribaculaceae bacterium]